MRDFAREMTKVTQSLETTADKIRALGRAGYPRAEIARFLDIRYQHVRNTLEAAKIPMPEKGADQMVSEAVEPRREAGLAEATVPFEPASAARDRYFALSLGPDGGIVLPKALREAMMLDEDGRVTAHVEEGELRIISPLAAIRRIQRIAQKYKKPGESVVDELIAERRAEALREDNET